MRSYVINYGRMCIQGDDSGRFWTGDAKKAFLALRSVHYNDDEPPPICRKTIALLIANVDIPRVFSWVRNAVVTDIPRPTPHFRLLTHFSIGTPHSPCSEFCIFSFSSQSLAPLAWLCNIGLTVNRLYFPSSVGADVSPR